MITTNGRQAGSQPVVPMNDQDDMFQAYEEVDDPYDDEDDDSEFDYALIDNDEEYLYDDTEDLQYPIDDFDFEDEDDGWYL